MKRYESSNSFLVEDYQDRCKQFKYDQRYLDALASTLLVQTPVAAVRHFEGKYYVSYNDTCKNKAVIAGIEVLINNKSADLLLAHYIAFNKSDFTEIIEAYAGSRKASPMIQGKVAEIPPVIQVKLKDLSDKANNMYSKLSKFYSDTKKFDTIISQNYSLIMGWVEKDKDTDKDKLDILKKAHPQEKTFGLKPLVYNNIRPTLDEQYYRLIKKCFNDSNFFDADTDKFIINSFDLTKEHNKNEILSLKELNKVYFDLLCDLSNPLKHSEPQSILNLRDTHSHLIKTLIRPLQDVTKLLSFLDINQTIVNIEILDNNTRLHADMNISREFSLAEEEYVGVSRLCCAGCHTVYDKQEYHYRGTHGMCIQTGWSPPAKQFHSTLQHLSNLADQYAQNTIAKKVRNAEDQDLYIETLHFCEGKELEAFQEILKSKFDKRASKQQRDLSDDESIEEEIILNELYSDFEPNTSLWDLKQNLGLLKSDDVEEVMLPHDNSWSTYQFLGIAGAATTIVLGGWVAYNYYWQDS